MLKQSFMMKSCIMALLLLISIGCSSARFIAPDNLSSNSIGDDDFRLQTADDHMDKDTVERVQEIVSPMSSSAAKTPTNDNTLSFRLSPIVHKTGKFEPSACNKAEGVFNLLPKGATSSVPACRSVNSMETEQRLSTSSNSPGVVHMQMIRPKSQERYVDILKSHHSHADNHVQQKKNNKRKLGSTPSPPGDGN